MLKRAGHGTLSLRLEETNVAWIRGEPQYGLVEVDLHGYSTETAVEVARSVITEAYENGLLYVRLIHGYNTSRSRTYPYGSPTIKEELLRLLLEGSLERYAYSFKSGRHVRRAGSITIALRPNPSPNPYPIWTALPERDYRD